MILFTQMEKTEIYYMNFNSIRLCSILKACIGRREKYECYRSLFAIEVEIGTFDQYPWLLLIVKYPNVFPEKLPVLLPDREVELCIDLVLGAQLVSIALHRIAPVELVELITMLNELLEKILSKQYFNVRRSNSLCKESLLYVENSTWIAGN